MKSKKFTLVELLIVCAIIAILLTMLFPSLSKARQKAKMAVCKSNIAQLVRANILYATKNNNNFVYRAMNDYRNVATQGHNNSWAFTMKTSDACGGKDDRAFFISELGIDKIWCPLQPRRLSNNQLTGNQSSEIHLPYSMFFGWKGAANGVDTYNEETNSNITMRLVNMNVPFVYQGREFNIGVSDTIHDLDDTYIKSSHQASTATAANIFYKIEKILLKQDANFGRLDGSVYEERNITYSSIGALTSTTHRFVWVPDRMNSNSPYPNSRRIPLPRVMNR